MFRTLQVLLIQIAWSKQCLQFFQITFALIVDWVNENLFIEILLRLLKKQNALYLPVFSTFFSAASLEYPWIWSKIFYKPSHS